MITKDRWLLGFCCESQFWVDKFLLFGLQTLPFLFDLFAKALHSLLEMPLGWEIIVHYLDDFLAVLPQDTDAALYKAEFDFLCLVLGWRINIDKDKLGYIIEFLAIELDSILIEARFPNKKFGKAIAAVNEVLNHG